MVQMHGDAVVGLAQKGLPLTGEDASLFSRFWAGGASGEEAQPSHTAPVGADSFRILQSFSLLPTPTTQETHAAMAGAVITKLKLREASLGRTRLCLSLPHHTAALLTTDSFLPRRWQGYHCQEQGGVGSASC